MKKICCSHCYWLFLFTLMPLVSVAQPTLQQGQWYFQPGAYVFDLDAAASTTEVAGTRLPGENLSFSGDTVPGVGVGYAFNDRWSLFTVVAYPPTTEAEGIGNNGFAGVNAVEVEYAPLALVGVYHFDFGRFQPFVGAGISYAAILDVNDQQVTDVAVDNAFGSIFRAGFDYMWNDRWGLALSVNKLFIDTTITGDAPVAPGVQAPAEVDVALDPLVYSFGLVYRM